MLPTESETAVAISLLAQAESRLVKLVVNATEEAQALEIACVLRDLTSVRMQLELPRPMDKRSSARIHERAVVCVKHSDGRTSDAALHDISAGGALLETDVEIADGEECVLQIPGVDRDVRAVARRASKGITPLVFAGLDPSQVIALVKHLERHFLRY